MFNGFGNLVIWLWKSFGNIFEVVCTNPVLKFSMLLGVLFFEG